jgi:hypothetical protein
VQALGVTLAAALSIAGATAGCTDAAGNGAFAGSGGSNGSGGAGCAPTVSVGEIITEVAASGTLPTPLGGTIIDGTYVLTKYEAYPPLSATNHTGATFEIAGAMLNLALVSDEFPAGLKGMATLKTTGMQLTITWLCGGSGTFGQWYTATDTELALIASPGVVQTFTKR